MPKLIAALVVSVLALAACSDSNALEDGAGRKLPVLDDDGPGLPEQPRMATDDSASDDSPDAGVDAANPGHQPQLKYGLHPDASDALRALGVTAGEITQTIGNAAASAGTHAKDGVAEGLAYSAATDLSVRGKTEAEIKLFLGKLGEAGFVAWYRKTGADGWSGVTHIHVVWAGCPMKLSLRNQVRSWLDGRNGLVSNSPYQFYQWPQSSKDLVRERFLAHNPQAG